MDVNALRSRLLFLLGDEMKNLTVTDLKECNFRTSRLVFSAIIFAGRTLHEEAERLSIVNDSRTRKLALLRNQTDSRDERKRVDEEYRHVFFEVILKALLDLQFPPALEPFSDPLSSLKDETDFRLAAMQYLVDNALVAAGSMADMSCLPVQSEDNSRRDNSDQPPQMDFTIAELSMENNRPFFPSTSSTLSKNKPIQQPQDPSSYSAASSSQIPPPSTSITANFDSHNRQPESLIGNNYNHGQQDSSDEKTKVDTTYSLDEYDTLSQSYEILQHHNEQLSKQLKALQDSVCQRNVMEVKMDLLMRDFSSMVCEIADISTSPSPSVESSAPPTPPLKYQNQNASRPLGVVLEEAASTRRKRPVSGSHAQESGKCRGTSDVPGGAASTVHWKQLQARIQDVHTRWKSMRREAKRSVLATVSLHAATSTQIRDKYSATGYDSRSLDSRSRSSSSSNSSFHQHQLPGHESRQSSRGHSTPRSTFGDPPSRRRTSSSGRSFTPTKKTAFGGGMNLNNANINYNVEASPAVCASLRKILGVQLPLSFCDNESDASSLESELDGKTEVSLDVPRVHQLQRDLVTFSRHAYSFSQLCAIDDEKKSGEAESCTLESQKQALQRRLTRLQSLNELRKSSRALLLHTACLSPLLPLACASPSLSSSKSGLDALQEMVQPVLEAKKLWSPTLQAAFDRASSEQYSLLVAVTHSDMRMQRWQTLAEQMNPLISNFADKLSSHCESSAKQVQESSMSLFALSRSLALAEEVRLALPQSNSSLVSPLEALCRGYFGEEIADLVNRLRMSVDDISRLCNSIQNVHKQMMAGITADIKMLVQCGDSINELSSSS